MQTGAVFHKHSITHLKWDPQLSWGLWEMWGAEHTRRQLCGGAQIRKETILPIKGLSLASRQLRYSRWGTAHPLNSGAWIREGLFSRASLCRESMRGWKQCRITN